ncbi:protein TolQ [Reinekea marinisedimentorum]|uniref:Tol-Pal system protein TolQ n=1 Tax=Reinekea marinisedimentorum TaxID=230495 RepID=A0A4R3I6I1_9GAMM|nr:protein TolQ [Reinekea marinisedimentorum]TCS40782.1 biopolymer transport protein TolQ [Reinekea marinisedimentorum]
MGEQLSYWQLIADASILVKLVMLVLVGLSVTTWVFIWERRNVLRDSFRKFAAFEERFWSGIDLAQLYRQVNASPEENSAGEAVFRAGFKEFTRLRQQHITDAEGIMAGCQRAMRVAVSKEAERLDSHLTFMATVGSTSPYIGLFGTVWGIMHSFLGLASVTQVSLATVAPGIAEALIATAMGLFAAIPAVVAFNRFSARSEKMLNSLETFTEEFSAILHRQAHLLESQHRKQAQ